MRRSVAQHRRTLVGCRIALALAAVGLLVLTVAVPAHAGRSCEARKPTVEIIEHGMQLAERTESAFEVEHARSGTTPSWCWGVPGRI